MVVGGAVEMVEEDKGTDGREREIWSPLKTDFIYGNTKSRWRQRRETKPG